MWSGFMCISKLQSVDCKVNSNNSNIHIEYRNFQRKVLWNHYKCHLQNLKKHLQSPKKEHSKTHPKLSEVPKNSHLSIFSRFFTPFSLPSFLPWVAPTFLAPPHVHRGRHHGQSPASLEPAPPVGPFAPETTGSPGGPTNRSCG